jgi:hypothetical protein
VVSAALLRHRRRHRLLEGLALLPRHSLALPAGLRVALLPVAIEIIDNWKKARCNFLHRRTRIFSALLNKRFFSLWSKYWIQDKI